MQEGDQSERWWQRGEQKQGVQQKLSWEHWAVPVGTGRGGKRPLDRWQRLVRLLWTGGSASYDLAMHLEVGMCKP